MWLQFRPDRSLRGLSCGAAHQSLYVAVEALAADALISILIDIITKSFIRLLKSPSNSWGIGIVNGLEDSSSGHLGDFYARVIANDQNY
jgi:hypothetical protein